MKKCKSVIKKYKLVVFILALLFALGVLWSSASTLGPKPKKKPVDLVEKGRFIFFNETIEGAVAFFNGDAFNNSPAGQFLRQTTGSDINLDGTQVVAVAAFLRVINALENIRQSLQMLESVTEKAHQKAGRTRRLLYQAAAETEDSIMVLASAGLHPKAVMHLKEALRIIQKAVQKRSFKNRHVREAIDRQEKARNELVETS